MNRQYPPSAESRRALAKYIINDLEINPFADLIPMLLGTHRLELSNGMLTVGDGGLTFPESLSGGSTMAVNEAAFARLVIHCLALAAPLTLVAAFVQAEHMARPRSELCANMWKSLAFLHVAPQAVCTALRCLRPDMIQAVQHLYGGWLQRCRSPQHIASALEDLVGAQWHVTSGSPACRALARLTTAAQVAVLPVKHVSQADIVVDSRAGLILSKRDKCFMALALACGPDAELARHGIPAFGTVRKEIPEAFVELAIGRHALDELTEA